jgi:CRP/FNR family transcriptional regulator, cyclic AMP receptor protein
MRDITPTIPQKDYEFVAPGLAIVDRLAQLMHNSRLFRGFSIQDIEILSEHMQVYRLGAGRVLLKEGERSAFAVWLLDVVVEVRKRGADGTLHGVATILPGKMIGEMSLVDGEARLATCVVIRRAEFAVLTHDDFVALLDNHPRLAAELLIRIAALVNHRLRETSAKLAARPEPDA